MKNIFYNLIEHSYYRLGLEPVKINSVKRKEILTDMIILEDIFDDMFNAWFPYYIILMTGLITMIYF